jgi:hypothetical protein
VSSLPFTASAEAALALWNDWCAAAKTWNLGDRRPSVLDLQTVCRETGLSLPDLDAFARTQGQLPVFLMVGGEAALASEIAALLNIQVQFPDLPSAPVSYSVSPANVVELRMRGSAGSAPASPEDVVNAAAAASEAQDVLVVEEMVASASPWKVVWIPHPAHFRFAEARPAEMEALLAQRAAVILAEDAPTALPEALQQIGQKLWIAPPTLRQSDDERTRLLGEIATLLDDRTEDWDIRAQAAWNWLAARLDTHIQTKRREYQQLLNQCEIKVSSSRHLLNQYRTNWINGVRSVVEVYLQNRVAGAAFAPLFDPGKPGPQVATFMSALGLPTMWSKLSEFVTDRMADFVAGLTGLAGRLELSRITLGDGSARWDARLLTPKLEAFLNERKVFPTASKRAGLVGNLTGRKQQVLDERKAQVSKAVRLLPAFVESEFAAWAGALTTAVEKGITLQLAAALANKGFPDEEGLRRAIEGLDRFERMLRGEGGATQRPPDVVTAHWMKLVAQGHLIPRYVPRSIEASPPAAAVG